MIEATNARTLWAMHPDALASHLQRVAVEGVLPEGVRGLTAVMGQREAKAPADPVRDGATVIIPVQGTLSPKGGWGTSTERFADQVRAAAADNKIGAIVLDIMSPGGLVWGTAEAGDAVFEARAAKPVIAVASPYAFSAAHWIATQASAFYATSSGEVGSVGVRMGHVDVSSFEDKIGMKTTLVASDPDKIAGHPYGPLSDEDRADMEAEVAESNRAFIAAIARGRGLSPADVPAIHGKGKTFSAARAQAAGIIDGVMSVRDVVAKYGSSRARLSLMRRRAEAEAALHAI
jgi:capsid assembly protease